MSILTGMLIGAFAGLVVWRAGDAIEETRAARFHERLCGIPPKKRVAVGRVLAIVAFIALIGLFVLAICTLARAGWDDLPVSENVILGAPDKINVWKVRPRAADEWSKRVTSKDEARLLPSPHRASVKTMQITGDGTPPPILLPTSRFTLQ